MLSALALWTVLSAAPFQWDVPEVVSVTDVAGEVKVDGVPVKMQVVVSRWDAPHLIQHFAQQFADAGFFLAPKQKSPAPQLILTAFDPHSGNTYSVIFDDGPGQGTTLVLGVAQFGRMERRAASADIAPVFPGAEVVVRSEDEGARMLSFTVAAKPEELRAYYANVLGAAGYQQTSADVYARGPDELAIALQPVANGRVHVLLMSRPTPVALQQ